MADLDSEFKYKDTATCYLFKTDGTPITDKNGDQLWIELHGMKSSTYKQIENDQNNRSIQKQRASKTYVPTAEEARERQLERAIRCVEDWHIEGKDDQLIPCTKENVRKLFTEYPRIFEVVDDFIHREVNFLMSSSTT